MKISACHLVSILATFAGLSVAQGLATSSNVADESSNNLARWKDRWETNTLGWHRSDVNDVIKAHGAKLLQADEACDVDMRVFVPLCGKSLDVAFFARDEGVTEVVGVDGIKKALLEFSNENPDLELKEADPIGSYEVLKGNKITLLKGDFFELTDASTGGKFAAIYDRASLVAIQPDLREKYAATMGQLIAPGGKILLVTVEHDTGTGPPFSILDSDVRSLYQGQDWVSSITQLNSDGTELDDRGRLSRWYIIQAK